MEIREIKKDELKYLDSEITIKGWVKNHRKQKEYGFIDLHDGTSFKSIQVVYTNELETFDDIQKMIDNAEEKDIIKVVEALKSVLSDS